MTLLQEVFYMCDQFLSHQRNVDTVPVDTNHKPYTRPISIILRYSELFFIEINILFIHHFILIINLVTTVQAANLKSDGGVIDRAVSLSTKKTNS